MQQTGQKDRNMIFLKAYSIDEVVMDIQNSRLSRVVLTAYSMQTSERT